MNIIICGVPVNDKGLYFCRCCGFESDDIERFATVYCWDCAHGECQDHGILEDAAAMEENPAHDPFLDRARLNFPEVTLSSR